MQALGKDIESIYVEELGIKFSREEIFKVLVIDPMMGAIDVDWRDFFPYLRWIPNKSMEMRIQRMVVHKTAVTKALIQEQKRRIASGEVIILLQHFFFSFVNTLVISYCPIFLLLIMVSNRRWTVMSTSSYPKGII